jgi:hypothetical protein
VASAVAMLYFQSQQNSTYTISSIYCLLYSVMSLSNATKNQQDIVSSTLHSYATKNLHVLGLPCLTYSASGVDKGLMGLTVLPFAYDAAVGFYILKSLFSKNIEQREADLIEEVNKTATEKEFNDRLPNVLKNGEVA